MISWEVFAQVAGSVAAGATFIGWIIRNFKLDMIARFDKIDARFERLESSMNERFNKVDIKFEKVEADLTELKQGQAFLEAANIYTMPLEPAEPNIRSQAAKDSWVRRRQSQKRLANKK